MSDDPDAQRSEFFELVRRWLKKKVSTDEIEKLIQAPECRADFVSEARRFLDGASTEHVCWYFSSTRKSWNQLAGRSGYALVLDGKVTDVLVTVVS